MLTTTDPAAQSRSARFPLLFLSSPGRQNIIILIRPKTDQTRPVGVRRFLTLGFVHLPFELQRQLRSARCATPAQRAAGLQEGQVKVISWLNRRLNGAPCRSRHLAAGPAWGGVMVPMQGRQAQTAVSDALRPAGQETSSELPMLKQAPQGHSKRSLSHPGAPLGRAAMALAVHYGENPSGSRR